MTRRTRHAGLSVSLFPFLAVLVCAMGALIFLLIVTTSRIRSESVARAMRELQEQFQPETVSAPRPLPVAEPVPVPPAVELPDDPAPPEIVQTFNWPDPNQPLQAQLSRLATQRDDLLQQQQQQARQLAAARSQLARLQEQQRRRQQELQAELSKSQVHATVVDTLRRQKQQTEQKIRRLEREIARAEGNAATKSSRYSLIPYDGDSGTTRRPILIECTGQGLRFLPEDIRIGEDELIGFTSGYNPLLAGSLALVEYWKKHDAEQAGASRPPHPPYVLLLVRQSGSMQYYMARKLLEKLGQPFGYELLNDDFPLALPELDPGAQQACQAAIDRLLDDRQQLLTDLSARHGRGRQVRLSRSGFDLVELQQRRPATRGSASRTATGNRAGTQFGTQSGSQTGTGTGATAGTRGTGTPNNPARSGQTTPSTPFGFRENTLAGTNSARPGSTSRSGASRDGSSRSGSSRDGNSPAGSGDLKSSRLPSGIPGSRPSGPLMQELAGRSAAGSGSGTGTGPGTGPGTGAETPTGTDSRPGTSEDSTALGSPFAQSTGGASRSGETGGSSSASGAPRIPQGTERFGTVASTSTPDESLFAPPRPGTTATRSSGSPSSGAAGNATSDPFATPGTGTAVNTPGGQPGNQASRQPGGSFGNGSQTSIPRELLTGTSPAAGSSGAPGTPGTSPASGPPASGTGSGTGSGSPSTPANLPRAGSMAALRAATSGATGSAASGTASSSTGLSGASGAGRPSAGGSGLSQILPDTSSPAARGLTTRRRGIGFEREITLALQADKALIGREIELKLGEGETAGQLSSQVLASLERTIVSWGQPPAGFYWVPRLRVQISPGGNVHYSRLRDEIARWGLETDVDQQLDPIRRPARQVPATN